MNCQYTPRCRKRAKIVVGYKRFFGTRIGPKGEEPVYSIATSFRCLDHTDVVNKIGEVSIEEWNSKGNCME